MSLFDESAVRDILAPLLRDPETPLRLLTHATPLPSQPYVLTERWIDSAGNTYLISGNRIIHTMDSPPRRHYPTWTTPYEARTGIVRLRMRASTIVEQLIPTFNLIKTQLHPFENHYRHTHYTFRWEKSGLYEFDNTPTLTLTFATDGTLLSMTNSLATTTLAVRSSEASIGHQSLNSFHKLPTSIKLIQEYAEACAAGG